MAGLFDFKSAEEILQERRAATKSNQQQLMNTILSVTPKENRQASMIGGQLGIALANILGSKTGDASLLNELRSSQTNTASIQQAIADIESTKVLTDTYLGGKGQATPEMEQSLVDSRANTEKTLGMMTKKMQDSIYSERFEKGIEENPSLLTNTDAMIQHAIDTKQIDTAMKLTNKKLSEAQAEETKKISFIKSLVAMNFKPEEALQKYKEVNNLGKEPEGSSVVNAPRPTTNNANFKSPEELLGGAKNSPEEEGFLVNLAKNYAGTVEATDEQVANYARKNNIKGIKSKQDLETLRKKASDELNQETNKNRSDNSSYSSFKTWLQQNL